MTLNEREAFWTEQLPIFKEKYWLPEHFEVLEFDLKGGCFEIIDGVKTDFSEDDLFEIYHRVNTGWAMWKKAVSFMEEKAKAQAVPEGHVVVPKEPTYKQIVALKNSCQFFKSIGVSYLEACFAYDAMIKAIESGAEG